MFRDRGTVSLDWGQWTMRALPDRLAVRADAADEASLRRIQDLLTARLQTFGWREHLTVKWQDLGGWGTHHGPFGTYLCRTGRVTRPAAG